MGNEEKLREVLLGKAKDTIGWLEAEDRASFMTGAGVAISKTTEYYESEIEKLKNRLKFYENIEKTAVNDLKTLSSIISKYSDRDD
jgi:hypothetical protein